jgi:hypothetical protein
MPDFFLLNNKNVSCFLLLGCLGSCILCLRIVFAISKCAILKNANSY